MPKNESSRFRPRERQLFRLAAEVSPHLPLEQQRIIAIRRLWSRNPSAANIDRLKAELGIRTNRTFIDTIGIIDDDPVLAHEWDKFEQACASQAPKRERRTTAAEQLYTFTDPDLYKAFIYQKVEQLARKGRYKTEIAAALGLPESLARSIRAFYADLGHLSNGYGSVGLAAAHKQELIDGLQIGVPVEGLAEKFQTTPDNIILLTKHFKNAGFLDPEILEQASSLAQTLKGPFQYISKSGQNPNPFEESSSKPETAGMSPRMLYRRILELSRAGKGGIEIAKELGITEYKARTIRSFFIRIELVKPLCIQESADEKIKLPYKGIHRMLSRGHSYSETAATLGLDYDIVKKLGGHMKNFGMLDKDGQSDS